VLDEATASVDAETVVCFVCQYFVREREREMVCVREREGERERERERERES